MDDYFENTFDAETADHAIRMAIQSTFDGVEGKDFDQKKHFDKWIKSIADSVLKQVSQENTKAKFSVVVTIQQKVGAGFLCQNKMRWDGKSADEGGDACVKVPWENSHIHCLVTLYAVKALAGFSSEQIRALKAMDLHVEAGI